MTNHYNKLIRDNIPDIAEKRGKRLVARRVQTDQEYWAKLKEKFQEEINEFGESQNMDTLVDILEVLDAIIEFKKFDVKELRALKENKRLEFGRFDKRIILEASDEELGHPLDDLI